MVLWSLLMQKITCDVNHIHKKIHELFNNGEEYEIDCLILPFTFKKSSILSLKKPNYPSINLKKLLPTLLNFFRRF